PATVGALAAGRGAVAPICPAAHLLAASLAACYGSGNTGPLPVEPHPASCGAGGVLAPGRGSQQQRHAALFALGRFGALDELLHGDRDEVVPAVASGAANYGATLADQRIGCPEVRSPLVARGAASLHSYAHSAVALG